MVDPDLEIREGGGGGWGLSGGSGVSHLDPKIRYGRLVLKSNFFPPFREGAALDPPVSLVRIIGAPGLLFRLFRE